MGIREVAKAAAEAEEVRQEAERKRMQHEHSRAAEQIVMKLIGLTGKATRSMTSAPTDSTDWGNRAVVKIEDDGEDMYFLVNCSRRTIRDWNQTVWGEPEYYLTICNATGQSVNIPSNGNRRQYTPWNSQDYKIKSLPDLSHALDRHDKALQESEGK